MPYYPDSLRIKAMLLKLYGKMGLAKTVTQLCKNMQVRPDHEIYDQTGDFEKLGAIRFDTVANYGQSDMLKELIDEYNEYYPKRIMENKNQLVQHYLKRNFEQIYQNVQMTEQLENSVLWQHFKVAKSVHLLQSNLLDSAKTYAMFQK